jgi:hypothetical protein
VRCGKAVERDRRSNGHVRQDFVSDWKPEQIPHRASANTNQARRYSADAWNCLRGVIDREHRTVAAADPHSPRIRPRKASIIGLPLAWNAGGIGVKEPALIG